MCVSLRVADIDAAPLRARRFIRAPARRHTAVPPMASMSALTLQPVVGARPSGGRRCARRAASRHSNAFTVTAQGSPGADNERQPASASVGVGRRTFGVGAVTLLASAVDAVSQPAVAFERPPPGFRPYNDTIDGYKLFRPEDWIEVKGSGNDIFFRNSSNVDENMFVSISSPSSTKYKTVADLGTPDDAARKVLNQYLTEFMSTRLGVRRESSVVSATERTLIGRFGWVWVSALIRPWRWAEGVDGEPILFYDVKLRIASYATKNQYGLTEADRPQVLEWDRVLTSHLGCANGRLYELRMQTAAETYEKSEKTFNIMRDSFKPFEVDQSNLSFPLF